MPVTGLPQRLRKILEVDGIKVGTRCNGFVWSQFGCWIVHDLGILSHPEKERRIAIYAERAAKQQPLFEAAREKNGEAF